MAGRRHRRRRAPPHRSRPGVCATSAPTSWWSQADVTDRGGDGGTSSARFARDPGAITTVIHAAGILHDALIALRTPVADSTVVDVKAKGALVLGQVFAKDPPDLFVLFSSVSSILGLPGQVDYTAANAFLDAFAAKANRTGADAGGRRQLERLARGRHGRRRGPRERDQAPVGRRSSRRPTRRSCSTPSTTGRGGHVLDRRSAARRHWLLAEHVVRGGEALIPGTGFLELRRGRAAGRRRRPAVELRDVFFLSPVRRRRRRGAHAEAEARPRHRQRSRCSATPRPRRTSPRRRRRSTTDAGPVHDLAAIRARCTAPGRPLRRLLGPVVHGLRTALGQPARASSYGDGEALVDDGDAGRRSPPSSPTSGCTRRCSTWPPGSAQALIPGFAPDETFYVPFSYGRVVLAGRSRPRASATCDCATASATRPRRVRHRRSCDEDGREVVARSRRSRCAGSSAAPRSTSLRRTDAPVAEPSGVGVDRRGRRARRHPAGRRARRVRPHRRARASPSRSWRPRSTSTTGWRRSTPRPQAPDAEGADGRRRPQYARPDLGSPTSPPATPDRARAGDDLARAARRRAGRPRRRLLRARRPVADRRAPVHPDEASSTPSTFRSRRCSRRPRSRSAPPSWRPSSASSTPTTPTAADASPTARAGAGRPEPALPVARHHPARQRRAAPVLLRPRRRRQRPQLPRPVAGDGPQPAVLRPAGARHRRHRRGRSTSIEEMAAAYLRRGPRACNRTGPTSSAATPAAGWSPSRWPSSSPASGETVALVVLFDTFPPQIPDRDVTLRMRVRRVRDEGWSYVSNIALRRIEERRAAQDLARIARHRGGERCRAAGAARDPRRADLPRSGPGSTGCGRGRATWC